MNACPKMYKMSTRESSDFICGRRKVPSSRLFHFTCTVVLFIGIIIIFMPTLHFIGQSAVFHVEICDPILKTRPKNTKPIFPLVLLSIPIQKYTLFVWNGKLAFGFGRCAGVVLFFLFRFVFGRRFRKSKFCVGISLLFFLLLFSKYYLVLSQFHSRAVCCLFLVFNPILSSHSHSNEERNKSESWKKAKAKSRY